jgi:hypothetical protein
MDRFLTSLVQLILFGSVAFCFRIIYLENKNK